MELSADYVERKEQLWAVLEKEDSTQDQVVELYKTWGPYFEHDINEWGYKPEEHLAEFAELAGTRDRKEIRVLDVAAGTGLFGEKLRDLGFTNIDALDMSAAMLEYARPKNIYTNFYVTMLGDYPVKDVPEGAYDMLVCGAAFCAEHHINVDCLPHLAKVVKPGGFMYIFSTEEWLGGRREYVNTRVQDLEAQGLWKLVRDPETPKPYFANHKTLNYILKIC